MKYNLRKTVRQIVTNLIGINFVSTVEEETHRTRVKRVDIFG